MKYLVMLVLLATACGPQCLRGHVEQKLWPAHFEDHGYMMQVGDVSIWIPINEWIPDQMIDVYICDQYEVEKMPK